MIVKNIRFGDGIIYYCKDCEKIVEASKESRRHVYVCNECGTKNVAFGSQKSIRSFYHIDDGEKMTDKAEHSSSGEELTGDASVAAEDEDKKEV